MATNTTMLGFVPNPSGRGTLGILWSCLTVLGLCAWTSLHLDLPSKWSTSLYVPGMLHPARNRLLIKIWWMLVMLFIPELVLMAVVHDWCKAYQAVARINREGQLLVSEMWTMNDGFFSEMGGFTRNGKVVYARGIADLIKDKTIPPQPSRTAEIRDKSKSDALGKTLTCAQALWLAIQCLARTIQHLPISTLELGIVGYVFIAVVINGLCWRKPKDVIMPMEVLSWQARGISPDEQRLDAPADTSERDVADNEEEKAFFSGRKPPTRWEAWLDQITRDAEKLEWVVVVSVCALYGGWHCLAWNFAFPSVDEQWLWRIASILTSLPAFVFLFTDRLPRRIQDHVNDILVIAALVLYILSRGFILVEMFIGLRRLPAGVFDTIQWMAFIPHV